MQKLCAANAACTTCSGCADTLHGQVCFCRDADLLLVANKGGFAFAVDPDSGEKVWATAVGKASTTVLIVLHSTLV